MSDRNFVVARTLAAELTSSRREEIVRRYWLRGELTPLAIANHLAGQRAPSLT